MAKDPEEYPDGLTQDDLEEPLELALDRKRDEAASEHQALDEPKQRRLLENWLGAPKVVEEVLGLLRARRGPGDACRVPLLLSLLAFLVWSGEPTT